MLLKLVNTARDQKAAIMRNMIKHASQGQPNFTSFIAVKIIVGSKVQLTVYLTNYQKIASGALVPRWT